MPVVQVASLECKSLIHGLIAKKRFIKKKKKIAKKRIKIMRLYRNILLELKLVVELGQVEYRKCKPLIWVISLPFISSPCSYSKIELPSLFVDSQGDLSWMQLSFLNIYYINVNYN